MPTYNSLGDYDYGHDSIDQSVGYGDTLFEDVRRAYDPMPEWETYRGKTLGLAPVASYTDPEMSAMNELLGRFGGMAGYNRWYGQLQGKKPRSWQAALNMIEAQEVTPEAVAGEVFEDTPGTEEEVGVYSPEVEPVTRSAQDAFDPDAAYAESDAMHRRHMADDLFEQKKHGVQYDIAMREGGGIRDLSPSEEDIAIRQVNEELGLGGASYPPVPPQELMTEDPMMSYGDPYVDSQPPSADPTPYGQAVPMGADVTVAPAPGHLGTLDPNAHPAASGMGAAQGLFQGSLGPILSMGSLNREPMPPAPPPVRGSVSGGQLQMEHIPQWTTQHFGGRPAGEFLRSVTGPSTAPSTMFAPGFQGIDQPWAEDTSKTTALKMLKAKGLEKDAMSQAFQEAAHMVNQ